MKIRMLPSWALLSIIIGSGLVAVVANGLYPLQREAERKEGVARDARDILLPELKSNLEIAAKMQSALAARELSLEKLDVTAWETISKGGLLVGLDKAEINRLLHVYNLVYRVNELRDRLVESLTGIQVALDTTPKTRQIIIDNLLTNLHELQSALADMKLEQ